MLSMQPIAVHMMITVGNIDTDDKEGDFTCYWVGQANDFTVMCQNWHTRLRLHTAVPQIYVIPLHFDYKHTAF